MAVAIVFEIMGAVESPKHIDIERLTGPYNERTVVEAIIDVIGAHLIHPHRSGWCSTSSFLWGTSRRVICVSGRD